MKSDFHQEYKGSIRSLERHVEDDFLSQLRTSCFRERSYSKCSGDVIRGDCIIDDIKYVIPLMNNRNGIKIHQYPYIIMLLLIASESLMINECDEFFNCMC